MQVGDDDEDITNSVETGFMGFLGTRYFRFLNPKSLKLNSLLYKEFPFLDTKDYRNNNISLPEVY